MIARQGPMTPAEIEALALRHHRCAPNWSGPDRMHADTARALRQQAARIAELEAALRPFAEAADDLDEHADDKHHIWEAPAAMGITAGHLRAAKKVLPP